MLDFSHWEYKTEGHLTTTEPPIIFYSIFEFRLYHKNDEIFDTINDVDRSIQLVVVWFLIFWNLTLAPNVTVVKKSIHLLVAPKIICKRDFVTT